MLEICVAFGLVEEAMTRSSRRGRELQGIARKLRTNLAAKGIEIEGSISYQNLGTEEACLKGSTC